MFNFVVTPRNFIIAKLSIRKPGSSSVLIKLHNNYDRSILIEILCRPVSVFGRYAFPFFSFSAIYIYIYSLKTSRITPTYILY